MNIRQIHDNKQAFMPLLLLADETEEAIGQYLERGELFALYDEDLRGVCVVTDEGENYELQNIAVDRKYQRQGYGRALVNFLFAHFSKPMIVATGDHPNTVPFYENCGFTFLRRIVNFFPEHFDYPIIEDGIQLIDKIYFMKA